MKAKIEVNKDNVKSKIVDFTNELQVLCKKYNVDMQLAENEATKDKFIVINIKDFMSIEDIKMEVEK